MSFEHCKIVEINFTVVIQFPNYLIWKESVDLGTGRLSIAELGPFLYFLKLATQDIHDLNCKNHNFEVKWKSNIKQ